jgi:hypothetical protein
MITAMMIAVILEMINKAIPTILVA